MIVKDTMGKFILEIDIERGIVFETLKGYWKPEDVQRLHDTYINRILPVLDASPWFKCCNLKEYTTSMITSDIHEHVSSIEQKNFKGAVIIINEDSTYKQVIKTQMLVCNNNTSHFIEFFSTENEAMSYLNDKSKL